MLKRNLFRRINLFLKKAENKKTRYVILISFAIVMSFILFYAGHFLFFRGQTQYDPQATPSETQRSPTAQTGAEASADSVRFVHKTEEINGMKQEIYILEIDPGMPGIRVQPVLSNDLIYGFETLSEMAERKNAYAAVTGGFFTQYGLPSGMVVIHGELISPSTGRYPVFVVENGKAAFREFKSSITVEYRRSSTSKSVNHGDNVADTGRTDSINTGSIPVSSFNSPAGEKSIAVYTSYYGKTNRAKKPNLSVTVTGNTVTGAAFCDGELEIPQNGMVISFFDTAGYSLENLPLQIGDTVALSHLPELATGADAYECGSWLVREGKIVVPLKDAFVGILTNRDPRTAIGVKEDGTVVLLTVDGRQPGYSAGFTGQELAEYLVSCGVKDAAMLDGGASTEMLFKGKLVSRPSYKGEERTLGGGILVVHGN